MDSLRTTRRGLTLIELLIVLAILVVLLLFLALVMRPVELMRQSRDGRRIADAAILKNTLDLYLSQAGKNATLNGILCDAKHTDPNHPWRASVKNTVGQDKPFVQPYFNPVNYFPINTVPLPSGDPPYVTVEYIGVASENVRATDGSGWVSAPLQTMAGGSPIANLPIDPINQPGPLAVPSGLAQEQNFFGSGNKPGFFYAFQCAGLKYEIDMNMESDKYGQSWSEYNIENKDGGTRACFNGFCDPFDNGAEYQQSDYVFDLNNDDDMNNDPVGSRLICAGKDPDPSDENPQGKAKCKFCLGDTDSDGDGNSDWMNEDKHTYVMCTIYPNPTDEFDTFIADSVYEVGNDPGLDL